jgi:2-polyprenyl-6-hydroxyphenyl methylase/3-demethylubiquinone-9 3-methyltransferase
MGAFAVGKAAKGVNPVSYIRNYNSMRGMNFSHDAHDWLGGYPYEDATADELHNRITSFGFHEIRSFRLPVKMGLFGAGCHEFVFEKN